MVGVDPFVSATEKRIQVSGYALPAVLEDCTPPATLRPLEWKKLRLQAIADALCEPFGLSARILGDEGGPFEKVAIDIDEKVAPFLVELAKQRGFVINDNEAGQLRIWRSIETGRPVARLVAGEPPVTEIRPTFSPQDYYSEITGFCPKKRGKKGTNHTEPNRWLTSPLRPMVFKLDDTERAETEEATKAKLGRMFANMLSLSVDVATWRDPQGAIWAPNTTITLLAPDAMIYRETEMLVRSVVLRQSKDATSATLELVLPGAFSGKVPEALPWDE
jgi:prophage tail gpP-like protein